MTLNLLIEQSRRKYFMAAFFPSKRTAWAVVLDCNEMDKTRIFAENRGFTLAELVIIILLIGILAVFVAPRMLDVTSTKAAAFADKLRADIRYTQNAAMTANRRYRVYVNTAPAPVPVAPAPPADAAAVERPA